MKGLVSMISRLLFIPVLLLCSCLPFHKQVTVKMVYREYLNAKDSSILIEIPAGKFTMGSNHADFHTKPVHIVYLDGFCIGKYEVTNAQYKIFCDSTGHRLPSDSGFVDMPHYFIAYPNYPVVNVSWVDAKAYCDWAGVRLPTEAEWEKSARGTNKREYPWGKEWDGKKCNHGSSLEDGTDSSDGYKYTAPVGSYSAGISLYGCYDMAGNVDEWCYDWYGEDYYSKSSNCNPKGPTVSSLGNGRVLRGGGWFGNIWNCRSAGRYCDFTVLKDFKRAWIGFRVAK
jgi:formylglycine-generating enzyme required for sulfatase activity